MATGDQKPGGKRGSGVGTGGQMPRKDPGLRPEKKPPYMKKK